MALLGDAFPESLRTELASGKTISVSDVLYKFCNFTTPPKNKYMVVCCLNPFLVLLINSNISEFIQRREELLCCQVDMSKEDHDFLEWDSVVNCIEAHDAFDITDMKEDISDNYLEVFRGSVKPYCMRDVYRAVEQSKVMKRSHKRIILASLQEYQ